MRNNRAASRASRVKRPGSGSLCNAPPVQLTIAPHVEVDVEVVEVR